MLLKKWVNAIHFTTMLKAQFASLGKFGLRPAIVSSCGLIPTKLNRAPYTTWESLRTFLTMTNTDDLWTVDDEYSWTSGSRQSLSDFLSKVWHWSYYSAVSNVVSILIIYSTSHPWCRMTVQNQWVCMWFSQWDVINMVLWSVDMGTRLWPIRRTWSQWRWGPGRSRGVTYVGIAVPEIS